MSSSIGEAIRYPFTNFKDKKRMCNYYWGLIPIIGGFILGGYQLRVFKEIFMKKRRELPAFGDFVENLKYGFFFFIISMVAIGVTIALFLLLLLAGLAGVGIGILLIIYAFFVISLMQLQYAETKQWKDGFNFIRATKNTFGNFGHFIFTFLKTFVVMLIFFTIPILMVSLFTATQNWLFYLLYIITLLLLAPPGTFATVHLWGTFYQERKFKY